MRWDMAAFTGNGIITTPTMDTLASQGTVFENAFATTAICMVSRASVFMGQHMARHGITSLFTNPATGGTTTTFTHPRNATRPADVSGFYEWSPNLLDWYAGDGVDGPPGGPTVTFSAETLGATTTVTATSNGTAGRLFFRAGALEIP
jgi:hypothetical protein